MKKIIMIFISFLLLTIGCQVQVREQSVEESYRYNNKKTTHTHTTTVVTRGAALSDEVGLGREEKSETPEIKK